MMTTTRIQFKVPDGPTRLPRGNELILRKARGFLRVEIGTKFNRYEYGGNMGNSYERSIAPLLDQLVGEEHRRMVEENGEFFRDRRNTYNDASYSWVVIVRHN